MVAGPLIRSFEAWQKAGGKNLFPVDPTTPLAARPYMQRPGGKPDGSDLIQKGLTGVGQGAASKLNQADKKYEQLASEGKLKSTPFSLPWTNEQTAQMKAAAVEKNKAATAAAKAKAGPAKNAPPSNVVEEAPKKKGFFGLF